MLEQADEHFRQIALCEPRAWHRKDYFSSGRKFVAAQPWPAGGAQGTGANKSAKMIRKNPLCAAPGIRGELIKLGIDIVRGLPSPVHGSTSEAAVEDSLDVTWLASLVGLPNTLRIQQSGFVSNRITYRNFKQV